MTDTRSATTVMLDLDAAASPGRHDVDARDATGVMIMEPAPNIMQALGDGVLDNATEVVKVRAVEVAAERRNDRCWPALMVAAQLRDGDRVVEAVWATGALAGPIVAVDSAAREYSSWGAAAKGDSRMGGIKDMLAGYPEVEAARRVLRGT